MADTKTTHVTNFLSVPTKMTEALLAGGRLREIVETIEVLAADDNGHIYAMCPVHSAWRLSSIEILNDAITNGTDYNVGLYDTDLVDADENLFGDAVSMATARVAPLDVLCEALAIENIKKPIWELLGLSADPHAWYFLCLTGVAVGTVDGTITVRVRYVDGT